MLVPELIRLKRDGGELSEEQIRFLVDGITDGSVTDVPHGGKDAVAAGIWAAISARLRASRGTD